MIELIDVGLQRGSFRLPATSLKIDARQCCVITGAAGTGKTTIAEALCGLQSIDTGTLLLRDQVANNIPVAQRGIGYLPQDVALFPNMSVSANIGFGLSVNRWPKEKKRARISELADQLQLNELLQRVPRQLSGGQQKRVAMARAIAIFPDIICLDEPFVSLDDDSKTLITDLLSDLRSKSAPTILVVTHQPQWITEISDFEYRVQSRSANTA